MSSRIVLLTEGLDGQDGGVQRVSRCVLDALREDACPTLIWSSNDTQGSEPMDRGGRIAIRAFNRRYLEMGIAALIGGGLPGDCRKVFCWHLAVAPVGLLLAWRLGAAFEVYLHGIEAWRALPMRQRFALRYAGAVGANSQYTLDRFRKEHPEFERLPGKVMRLGLPQGWEAAATGASGIDEGDGPFFLTVTRLAESYKGETTLIQAFKEVRAKHPSVRLVVVGDGPERGRWEEDIRAAGLGGAVRMVGRVADTELKALYSRCRAFVLLSEAEGFGLAFLEAMSFGKPCVAAEAGAVPELVQNGRTGLLVPAREAGATAQALRQLLETDGLAARLGNEGRQEVLRQYTPERFRERLLEYMAL
jgi:glycosyltransferase involved in cell wall biosynthesis